MKPIWRYTNDLLDYLSNPKQKRFQNYKDNSATNIASKATKIKCKMHENIAMNDNTFALNLPSVLGRPVCLWNPRRWMKWLYCKFPNTKLLKPEFIVDIDMVNKAFLSHLMTFETLKEKKRKLK